MWKELWLAKDLAMSVVPRGRRRWSFPWVIWGLVPAGLSISDKICDFILVFWWRPGHCAFFSQKEKNTLPSSVPRCWPPPRESFTSLFSVHPTSQPADQPPDPYSGASQTSLPVLSRHILGNVYLFKTTLFLRTDTDSYHLQTSHALCRKTTLTGL